MIEKGTQILFALGFKETIDVVGDYSEGNKLYYYNLGNSEYIIFVTTNESKKKDLQCFDAWISIYEDSTQIGNVPTVDQKMLRSNFNFANDLSLLRQYIPIQKSDVKCSTSGLSLNSIKQKFK